MGKKCSTMFILCYLLLLFSFYCFCASKVACLMWIYYSELFSFSLFCFPLFYFHFYFFKDFHLFTFRQRLRKEKREGKKHYCVVVSHAPPTGDLVCNPHMCPDWESNQRPFGLQASAQSTEPHQPGLLSPLLNEDIYYLGFSCSVPFCHLDLNFYFISAVPNLLNILKFAFFEV